jgi:seryl-tRNA synthetase
VPLAKPVPLAYATEVERRIFFVSSHIVDFELIPRGDALAEISLVCDAPLDETNLAEKINFMVENDVAGQRIFLPKVVWKSASRRAADDTTFSRLVEDDAAQEIGAGQVVLGEPLIALVHYFDDAIKAMVKQRYGAREYRYPTLISTRTLETCGYFSSFPQYLMFVTRLHSDVAAYRAFQEEYAQQGKIDASVLGSCDNVDYCLPPTMCFHTFGHYAGRVLESGGLHTVTTKGKSFRFESRYATTLERLWDFTIREIVFMGPRDLVLQAREELMEVVFDFMDGLGLAGLCEVGNDPFFCNSDTADRVGAQRMMELKYELRLDVAADRSVAVASFNFHDDFFVSSFGITGGDGAQLFSGCAGFGLERLVYAFLCQYGSDPAGWPAAVASATAEALGR